MENSQQIFYITLQSRDWLLFLLTPGPIASLCSQTPLQLKIAMWLILVTAHAMRAKVLSATTRLNPLKTSCGIRCLLSVFPIYWLNRPGLQEYRKGKSCKMETRSANNHMEGYPLSRNICFELCGSKKLKLYNIKPLRFGGLFDITASISYLT